MELMEILGSVLTGGATGLIGTGISQAVDFFKTRQANAHELALLGEERENLKLEIQGRERVAVIEGETAIQVGELSALASSYEMDKATYSRGDSKWLVAVDVLRGSTRPLLTAGLVIFMTVLWATTDDKALEAQIVTTALYLATAAVLWWFGTRPPKKAQ